MVRLADYLDVWIVEAFSIVAIDADFGVGIKGAATLSFQLVHQVNKTIDFYAIMSIGGPGHRTDPTVDVLTLDERLLLES